MINSSLQTFSFTMALNFLHLALQYKNKMKEIFMNKSANRHPLNSTGDYFCTYPESDFDDGCIQCGICPTSLPEVFTEDEDGFAYVHRQPDSDLIEFVNELIKDCPVGSIKKA